MCLLNSSKLLPYRPVYGCFCRSMGVFASKWIDLAAVRKGLLILKKLPVRHGFSVADGHHDRNRRGSSLQHALLSPVCAGWRHIAPRCPILIAVPLGSFAAMTRRHLNPGQLAMVAAELEPLYAEAVKRRQGHQRDAGGARWKTGPEQDKALEADLPQARTPQARDDAAKATGAAGRTVGRAKGRRWKTGPEQDKALVAERPGSSPAEHRARDDAAKATGAAGRTVGRAKGRRWKTGPEQDKALVADLPQATKARDGVSYRASARRRVRGQSAHPTGSSLWRIKTQ
jgi:hypothetical protein